MQGIDVDLFNSFLWWGAVTFKWLIIVLVMFTGSLLIDLVVRRGGERDEI